MAENREPLTIRLEQKLGRSVREGSENAIGDIVGRSLSAEAGRRIACFIRQIDLGIEVVQGEE